MPVAHTPSRPRASVQAALLASVSALTLLAAAAPAKAGNILVPGGASGVSAAVTAQAAALASAQKAAAVAAQAQNSLTRATQAIQAMRTMQSAQRALALSLSSAVPNGLASGGLEPDSGLAGNGVANPVTTWVGANTPTQSTSSGQTTVSIQQTQPQALLNWKTFNVGSQTTVEFNQQGNASWVALNQISATGVPSHIRGAIKADGQVYLINPNGIVFEGSSQVNVNALIASSASISTSQFLNNGIYSASTGKFATPYAPSFTNAGGPITVDAGAEIVTNAPGSATAGGGFVMLLGTTVQNAGSIATQDGQIMLAAGDNFLIRPGYSASGSAGDPTSLIGTDTGSTFSTTRGNEVAISLNTPGSSLNGGSGGVSNTGVLAASTGDISLVGETVTQAGIALSTTSAAMRGTIHLLSSASDPNASVTLTPGSITLIAPDASATTALDSQRAALIADSATQDGGRLADHNMFLGGQFDDLGRLADLEDESRIEITSGGTVEFQGNSLAMAQGGQIAVSAVTRAQVDNGAVLDVSGDTAMLSAMANVLDITVEGNELRDAPVNRETGDLFNSDVFVDAANLVLLPAGTDGDAANRYYTAGGLLEVSGWLANVPHSIQEWATVGGQVTLSTGATGAVVTQAGSIINLSGGTVQYQGGVVPLTWLKGSDGLLYNINTAPAGLTYTGIYNGFVVQHTRWGVSETYANPIGPGAPTTFQPGYTIGRAAGSLILSTPTAIIEGTVDAAVYNGMQQIAAAPAGALDPYTAGFLDPYAFTQTTVAMPGSLLLGNYLGGGLATATAGYATDVAFDDATAVVADGIGVASALPADRVNTAWFDAGLIDGYGLGGLSVTTGNAGSITVASPLTLANGAQAILTAPIVTIDANVTTPGGSIKLSNLGQNLNVPIVLTPATDAGPANITVGPDAAISTAGLWTNELLDPADVTGQAYVNGGTISIDSSAGVTLAANSLLDVSSGAAILTNGKTIGGAGGNVTVTANDPNVASTDSSSWGALTLDGTIKGFGVTKGGALTVLAPSVLIAASNTAPNPLQVLLNTAFFQQGFSNYVITGAQDVDVAAGAAVDVTMPVYQFTAASFAAPTGSDPSTAMSLSLPPLFIANPATRTVTQRGGASLTLQTETPGAPQSSSFVGGTLEVEQGAAINVDPGQSVTLQGLRQMTVDGAITARGGSISIIDAHQAGFDTNIDPQGLSIWIGPDAVLDANGLAAVATDQQGLTYGKVTAGGSILIGNTGVMQTNGAFGSNGALSTDAFVIVRPGALLEAGGASAVLQLPNAGLGKVPASALTDATNGGAITFSSTSGIYMDGTMTAKAGGPTAAGGSLTVILEGIVSPRAIPDDIGMPRVITIGQAWQPSDLSADLMPGATDPALLGGQAVFAADQIKAAGFDNLSLFARDAFRFDGDVTLTAGQSVTLKEGVLTDTQANSRVSVAAPYVLLSGVTGLGGFEGTFTSTGLAQSGSWAPSTQASSGSLTVAGDLIDIQNTVATGLHEAKGDFAGFGDLDFESYGDIRFGNGAVLSTGDISLAAAQLYPTTNSTAYVIAGINNTGSAGPTGAVTIDRIGALDPTSLATMEALVGGTPVTDPLLPLSVFGSLTLTGNTVADSGVVRVPEGHLAFGSTGTVGPSNLFSIVTQSVALLPGSLTSISMGGLTVPYGGTTDGVAYDHNGLAVSFPATSSSILQLNGPSVTVASGAVLDLSGGGTLSGAGFTPGEGGSVDTLYNPLMTISGGKVSAPSLATNPVYAIVAGPQPGYAPLNTGSMTGAAGSAPMVGQQVTIPAGVPGLPAGTYTLLPAIYALQPGGYRVELDGVASVTTPAAVARTDGSYFATATTGIANTGFSGSLPNAITITPGAVVRTYSSYDQEGYSAFAIAQAQQSGTPVPFLPEDAKMLSLTLVSGAPSAFAFNGTALMGAPDGRGGAVIVQAQAPNGQGTDLEITASQGQTQGFSGVSVAATDLDALDATSLFVGGGFGLFAGDFVATDRSTTSVTLRNGAVLEAAQVILIAQGRTGGPGVLSGITVESGGGINTTSFGAAPAVLADGSSGVGTTSVLVVSNGSIIFNGNNAGGGQVGAITLGGDDPDATTGFFSNGTIALSTPGAIKIGDNVRFGTKSLQLAVTNLNLGDTADAASAGAVIPSGYNLNQEVLNALLRGMGGAPAAQELRLTVGQSVNVFGSADLSTIDPTTGQSSLQELVIDTPAIYGYGSASDTATITTGTLVWNGLQRGNSSVGVNAPSAAPVPVAAGGPGSAGHAIGALDIVADDIVFGYAADQPPTTAAPLDRLMLGFSTVNLQASDQITANAHGTLTVYESQVADHSQPGTGGTLNLVTPLLTTASGASMSYTAGGSLTLAPGAGQAPAITAHVTTLGGEIDLNANTIALDSSIALPSGKLVVEAAGDVTLGGGAQIDMAGRTIPMFDLIEFSPGGSASFESDGGSINQATGSVIDISATGADAGSVAFTAIAPGAGALVLDGTILGAAPDGNLGGSFTANAQSIAFDDGSITDGTGANFAALNAMLDAGGVFGARTTDLKQGDLIITDGLKAKAVTVSVDNGSLTVDGTIDASGATPGTIRLAAQGDLTLAGALDAHGSVLQVDSYNQPIEAENRGEIDLTTTGGKLTLAATSTMDVSVTAPDGTLLAANGLITLNAPRLGSNGASATGAGAPANATGGGIDILVADGLTIKGAGSIAVNSFASYKNAAYDPNDATTQIVDQAFLDQIDQDSTAFITGALGRYFVGGRLIDAGDGTGLSGLNPYLSAVHVQPGVEIASATANGNLKVAGDLDFSGYRYASVNPNYQKTSIYGSGEAGVFVLRAGGNITINGSITDGFATPPSSPADNGWVVRAAGTLTSPLTLSDSVVLGAGSTLAPGSILSFALPVTSASSTLAANTAALGGQALANAYTIPVGTQLTTSLTVNSYLTTGNVLDDIYDQTDQNGLVATTATAWAVPPGNPNNRVEDTTGRFYRYANGDVVPAGTGLVYINLSGGYVIPAGVFAGNGVFKSSRTYSAGTTLSSAVTLPAGFVLPTGVKLPDAVSVTNVLTAKTASSAGTVLAASYIIPAGTTLTSALTVNSYLTTGNVLDDIYDQTDQNGLVATTATAWAVPPGNPNNRVEDTTGRFYRYANGDVVPAGTGLVYINLSGGYVIPAGVFAGNGVYKSSRAYGAGTTLSSAVTLPAGFALPTGTVLPTTAYTVVTGITLAAGTIIPSGVVDTVSGNSGYVTLGADATLPSNLAITGTITLPNGASYTSGSIVSGTVLPAGTTISSGQAINFDAPISSVIWPSNVALPFTTVVTLTADTQEAPGATLTAGSNLLGVNGSSNLTGPARPVYALAPMLASGSQSWSMLLASGADLAAADPRGLKTRASLGGSGNMILSDPHIDPLTNANVASVIRTGTGDLDLMVGGSLSEASLFGVYTAGTQSQPVGDTVANPLAGIGGQPASVNEFQLPLGLKPDGSGTVLGSGNGVYEATLADYQANYPEHGGDLLISVQGDLTGQIDPSANPNINNALVGNWLGRQGGAGQATAWWINFGSYAPNNAVGGSGAVLTGFTGFGTLGSGNATILVGGNAGILTAPSPGNSPTTGLMVAVGSTGRVLSDGTLVETGGGDLTLHIGGAFNPGSTVIAQGPTTNTEGTITDLRGDISLSAGAIGTIVMSYGVINADDGNVGGPLVGSGLPVGGPLIEIGDGSVRLETRGDLVLGNVANPGLDPYTYLLGTAGAGSTVAKPVDVKSYFSLWTPTSAVDLFSAGGNLSVSAPLSFANNIRDDMTDGNSGGKGFDYPPILNAVAATGSIFNGTLDGTMVELAPSPDGQLNLLAGQSISVGGSLAIGISGANPDGLVNPLNPSVDIGGPITFPFISPQSLYKFEADTPTTAVHQDDPDPVHIYAVNGDIVGLTFGSQPTSTTTVAAKPAEIRAGRDIVDLSTVIMNNNADDVSLIEAGRDIYYANADIAGPGNLAVEAGRNLFQGSKGSLVSLGLLFDVNQGNVDGGANITALAGVGANGPDYADFASLYLDPANAGKVTQNYDQALFDWLTSTASNGQRLFPAFTGGEADAYAFFKTLDPQQQGVFLRQVYFDELNASGLDFNNPSAKDFRSYARGKLAIATLFPGIGPNDGGANADTGDLSMFSTIQYFDFFGRPVPAPVPNGTSVQTDGSIRTEFGGSVQILTPGGETLLGVEGITPGPTAGALTQGTGDIDVYADNSILLGESRALTTFGGNIVMWSATGDINAGRGAKTTIVLSPARMTYDDWGDITISPPVPVNGAGIATIAPIPGIAPGDINLVAPLGTVDAGEAGIRVSGNFNVAALQLLNAANIQVQGTATGIPVAATPNLGALTTASNTAGQAAAAASEAAARSRQAPAQQDLPSIITVEVIGYGGGDGATQPRKDTRPRKTTDQSSRQGGQTYDPDSGLQLVGNGRLTDEQRKDLTAAERSRLDRLMGQNGSL